MNPGVVALDALVDYGVFAKGETPGSGATQYWATRAPTKREWKDVAGLIHKASSWAGTRGLSVVCGRTANEVVYIYRGEAMQSTATHLPIGTRVVATEAAIADHKVPHYKGVAGTVHEERGEYRVVKWDGGFVSLWDRVELEDAPSKP